MFHVRKRTQTQMGSSLSSQMPRSANGTGVAIQARQIALSFDETVTPWTGSLTPHHNLRTN